MRWSLILLSLIVAVGCDVRDDDDDPERDMRRRDTDPPIDMTVPVDSSPDMDPATPCRDDLDCIPGYVCTGRDAEGGSVCAPGCAPDVSCPGNDVCDAETRRCVRRCRFDADCDFGFACLDGRCVSLPCRVMVDGACRETRSARCPLAADLIADNGCADVDGDCFVADCAVEAPPAMHDCDDRRFDVNPVALETCDADVDADCDGQTTESFEELAGDCAACERPGAIECAVDDPYRTACSTALGQSGGVAVEERCDGLDDDCDGRVDERCIYGEARNLEAVATCGARGLLVARAGGLQIWPSTGPPETAARVRPPGSGVRFPGCGDRGLVWIEADGPCVEGDGPVACPGVVWTWRDGDDSPTPASGPGDVGPPVMVGDRAIWHAMVGGEPRLLARGPDREAAERISDYAASDPAPALGGSPDAPLALRGWFEGRPFVTLFDPGARRPVIAQHPPGELRPGPPAASFRWLAWSAAGPRAQASIWVAPVEGGVGFRPAPRPGQQVAPRLADDRVVWLEGEPDGPRALHLVDLRNASERVIARGHIADEGFAIDTAALWWIARDDSDTVRRHGFVDREVIRQRCDRISDDDGDGLIACADPDCDGHPACPQPIEPTEDCAAPGDDDGDRLPDCADPDCDDDPACAIVPLAPPGAALEQPGSLGPDDPAWVRPDAACEPRMAPPGDVLRFDVYRTLRLANPADTPRTVHVTARFESGGGALFAYSDPFALGRCLAGDDPTVGGAERRLELIFAPGETRVVVPSTFAGADDHGPYALDVVTRPPTIELAAPGEPVDFEGTFDEATWQPPAACGEGGADGEDARRYAIVELGNPDGADAMATVTLDGPGRLHGFSGAAPLDVAGRDRCLTADDPLDDDPLTARIALPVPAGGAALVVVSDGGADGGYTLRISR